MSQPSGVRRLQLGLLQLVQPFVAFRCYLDHFDQQRRHRVRRQHHSIRQARDNGVLRMTSRPRLGALCPSPSKTARVIHLVRLAQTSRRWLVVRRLLLQPTIPVFVRFTVDQRRQSERGMCTSYVDTFAGSCGRIERLSSESSTFQAH